MIPLARVVHALPGRKRIKIEEKRGDEMYFAMVKKELAGSPGVLAVEVNSLTASVLVHHTANDMGVLHHAAEQGLFRLAKGDLGAPTADALGAANLEAVDRGLRVVSSVGRNLRPLMFLGLAGLGIAQAIEGNIAVPALTAFWYALNTLPRTNDSQHMERSFLDPPARL